MSSAGHILDMINRIKQNKIAKRKKFKGDNRENIYSEKFDKATEYDFPNATGKQLEFIKHRIRQTASEQRRKSYIILFLSILFTALVFLLLFNKL